MGILEILSEKLDKELFTEDVQEQIKAQFDVAVNEQVKHQLAEKEAELEEKVESDLADFKSELIESMDKFLETVAENFLKENAVAIASEVKVEMAENVIKSFKEAFTQNYINVPEDEVDVVSQLESQSAEYKERANKAIRESMEAKAQIFEMEKAMSFMKLTEGFSESKREQLVDMLEGLEFTDIQDFERKLEVVKEKLVESKRPEPTDNVITEDLTDADDDAPSTSNPYLTALYGK